VVAVPVIEGGVVADKALAHAFRVTNGKKFRLMDYDPGDTKDTASKDGCAEAMQAGLLKLTELQARLFAEDRWALLLIFQAMDAAGKDSTIKHVMSGVNPQGCEVYSFKAPSAEELDHDFLWRTTRYLPERGRIGIFNRSYYEEVLAVRVHPEFLQAQKLPHISKNIWKERFADIAAQERYLSRNGVVIRKFFLNVSKDEQRKRFLERLNKPEKNWKFSPVDMKEREHWDEYMKAYEDMIRNTASDEAPWYVVPADKKWFTRLVVSEVIVETLEQLKLKYPEVNSEKRKELKRQQEFLSAEK
jgi:PPK2 family polyphosphate:nucleotide phosphotransferase